MEAAYFVCLIGPIFQLSLIYAFIGCPQSVVLCVISYTHCTLISCEKNHPKYGNILQYYNVKIDILLTFMNFLLETLYCTESLFFAVENMKRQRQNSVFENSFFSLPRLFMQAPTEKHCAQCLMISIFLSIQTPYPFCPID